MSCTSNQKHILSPHLILDELHLEVFTKLRQHETGNREGMDVSILVFEPLSDNQIKLSFAGAKNGFYWISKNQDIATIEHIKGVRRGVAGNQMVSADFVTQVFTLSTQDMIYVGTDGYQDQNDDKRKKFGRERLKQLFLEMNSKDIESQFEFLEETLNHHMQNTSQRDDILWLGIRV